mmetsp:Transcript_29662/g.87979  ORF Transcript_29662/g.87979 Transcript_29662/m.87979 type:complete len:345 (+) Transcript_29662:768-1802(+)
MPTLKEISKAEKRRGGILQRASPGGGGGTHTSTSWQMCSCIQSHHIVKLNSQVRRKHARQSADGSLRNRPRSRLGNYSVGRPHVLVHVINETVHLNRHPLPPLFGLQLFLGPLVISAHHHHLKGRIGRIVGSIGIELGPQRLGLTDYPAHSVTSPHHQYRGYILLEFQFVAELRFALLCSRDDALLSLGGGGLARTEGEPSEQSTLLLPSRGFSCGGSVGVVTPKAGTDGKAAFDQLGGLNASLDGGIVEHVGRDEARVDALVEPRGMRPPQIRHDRHERSRPSLRPGLPVCIQTGHNLERYILTQRMNAHDHLGPLARITRFAGHALLERIEAERLEEEFVEG